MVDAERVRAWMNFKQWSAADLARAAGVSRQTVGRLLKGADLRTSRLLKIAEALGAGLDDLLGRGPAHKVSSDLLQLLSELSPAQQHEILVYTLFKAGRINRQPRAALPPGVQVSGRIR